MRKLAMNSAGGCRFAVDPIVALWIYKIFECRERKYQALATPLKFALVNRTLAHSIYKSRNDSESGLGSIAR
jgi:hypothetical protein